MSPSLNNSSNLKEIGKDALYYVPAKIIPALVGFLSIVVYTRLLDPSEYGLYILVMTTISTVYAFGFNWIGYVVWRYFTKYKNDDNISEFLSTIFTVTGIAFVVVGLLWYAVSIFLKGRTGDHFIHLLRIGLVVLGVQIGFSHILEILRLDRKSARYSLYSSINALGTLFLAIVLLCALAYGAQAILLATIIISGGIFLFEMKRIYKRWKIKCPYISRTILKRTLIFGMPQIGIAGGAILLSIADRYMIGAFIGSRAVGVYAVGYTIANLGIQLPLSILILAAIPVIVGTFENKGELETSILLKKLLSIYYVLLTPVAFGIAVLSKDIIGIVVGKSFQETFVVLPWVAAGVFFFGLSQLINTPFQLKEKPLLVAYLIFLSAILNIVLNFFMIPQFGIIGAAYSTLIAYFIYCVCSYLVIRRIFPISLPWVAIGKSLLASIGMCLTLYFVAGILKFSIGSTILKIGLGVTSYFLILMLLREQTVLGSLRYVDNYRKG